jgi:putative endonuclease
MKKTYQFGILAEKVAMILLFLKGYKILKWRYKTHFGEIDIIAKKSKTLIAVEVKARKSAFLYEEVLLPKQISRLKKALDFFHATNPQLHDHDLRFDFIEVNRFFWPKHHVNFIS